MPAASARAVHPMARRAGTAAGDVPRPAGLGGEPLPRHPGGTGGSAAVRRHHPELDQAGRLRQQRTGDVRPHRRSRAPPAAPHGGRGVHLPARRGDAPADPAAGRPLSRRHDRGRAAGRHRARLRPAGAVTGDRAAAGGAAGRPRLVPAPHHGGSGRQDFRRAEGAGLRGHVCLHRATGGSPSARARRRLDQPTGHRLRRDRATRPADRGDDQRDHDAGRPRNHRQHDLAGNACAAGASRGVRAAWPHRGCPTSSKS
jgi:hypothetical protein